MLLTQLHIKNFRCFTDTTIELDGPLILIEGMNGSGKTSFLEALHYLCYLRSFRTHSPKELMQFGADTFFVRASFKNNDPYDATQHEIQAGFSGKKRLVKINQKSIGSYKELMDFYRIVTLTEDDLFLINGGPEVRRLFIDQAITLFNPEYANALRSLRQIIDHRNATFYGSFKEDSYEVWTYQLWEKSLHIQQTRQKALAHLQQGINTLLAEHFNALSITLDYKPKYPPSSSFEEFQLSFPQLKQDERRQGRSLFGAHLDDIVIKFQDQKSKSYASRGQQKLAVLLLKIAQIQDLIRQKGPAIFLLDDFMTDFDGNRANTLIAILMKLNIQLIFTYPHASSLLENLLISQGGRKIKLTH